MATNRHDTLDPALLRPGRLDRKIEFPMPSRRERRLIFQTATSKMNLGPDVDLEDCERHAHFFFLIFTDPLVILFRRFTARPFIIRRDCVSRSSCRFTGYSTTAVLLFATIDQNITAVRKNRYVILPIDFEEAWKVGNFFPAYMNAISNTSFSLPLANSQEKRRDTRVLYARKSTVCYM